MDWAESWARDRFLFLALSCAELRICLGGRSSEMITNLAAAQVPESQYTSTHTHDLSAGIVPDEITLFPQDGQEFVHEWERAAH